MRNVYGFAPSRDDQQKAAPGGEYAKRVAKCPLPHA